MGPSATAVAEPVNIFFDFDYTLVADDGNLRPGTHHLLARLKQDSHRVFIWSGLGLRTEEAARHNLLQFLDGIYRKPIKDYERGLVDFGVSVRPDAVVDDHPAIVQHFGGIVIRAYIWPEPRDAELQRVYSELRRLALRRGVTDRFRSCGQGPREQDVSG